MANEMPKNIELLYNGALANIQFIKKQEWAYTSSALAVYGALVASTKSIQLEPWAKIFLYAAILISWVFSAFIYRGMAKSLSNSREEIDVILRGPYFNQTIPSRDCFDRCGLFVGLLLIVGIGALIAAYAICRAPLLYAPCL